jgi:hypothetical protein
MRFSGVLWIVFWVVFSCSYNDEAVTSGGLPGDDINTFTGGPDDDVVSGDPKWSMPVTSEFYTTARHQVGKWHHSGGTEVATDVYTDEEVRPGLPDADWWSELSDNLDDPARLVPLQDCGDRGPILRQRLISALDGRVEQMKQQAYLVSMVKTCLGDSADCKIKLSNKCNGGMMTLLSGGMETDFNFLTGGPVSVSSTNNQVAGVEEADFVKTDGQYIYIVSDGRFQIIDAWPPTQAHVVSSVLIDGVPKRLFITDDTAVVFAAGSPIEPPAIELFECSDMNNWLFAADENCTYGYDCDFTGDGHALSVLQYDISDRESPQLRRRLDFSGAYVNARRIDEAVYIVLEFPPPDLPGLQFWPDGLLDVMPASYDLWDLVNGTVPELSQAAIGLFDELKENNREIILAADLSDQLWPQGTDTVWVNGKQISTALNLADCDGLLLSPLEQAGALMGIVGYKLDGTDPPHGALVLSRPGAVYADEDALYLAIRQSAVQSMFWPTEFSEDHVTTVHRFVLDPAVAEVSYSGSGAVPGRLLNQFAMDEQDEFLRIATTSGFPGSGSSSSGVYVLEQVGTGLDVVGSVEGLGPGEDIRAVRFVGSTGYIVTFEKTDPLYVIDLADPTAPEVSGELVIPGFSTYIHPYDESHLLTIGYDADDMGIFSWFDGIRLQLFDVSDMTNPILLHKEVIGTRGSSSDAATNHLAFNWFAPAEQLALPMVVCEGGGNGQYGTDLTFNGLMVYKVTPEQGFQFSGGISHDIPDDDKGFCFNWWTQSNSSVKRSIFMDEWVFSVALDSIRIANLTNLMNPVKSLQLD